MAKKKTTQETLRREAAQQSATARQQARAVSLSALREQAALLRHAQRLARLAHVITGPDGSFHTWSETLPALVGIPASELVDSTRRWLDLIHPEDRKRFRSTAVRAMKNASRAEIEYRLWRRGEGWAHVRQVMEPVPGQPDANGRRRWFNTLQDITSEKQAEERIWRLNRLYAMLSGINGLVVRVRSREQLFVDACDVAVRHGGFRAAWIGIRDEKGRLLPTAWAGDLGAVLASPPESIMAGDAAYARAGRVLDEGRPALLTDLSTIDRAGRDLLKALGVVSIALVPLRNNGQAVAVLALYAHSTSFFDDEEIRLLEDLGGDIAFAIDYLEKRHRAEYLAYYDPVTNLANRTLFFERLQEQLAAAERSQARLALLIFDIEHFRTINETYGRAGADGVLKGVAERLASAAPGRNVGRVGPDLFALAVPDIASAEGLIRDAQDRSQAIFSAPFPVPGNRIAVSARLGIAIHPNDGRDAEALFRNAEAALQKAKAAREPYLFYEAGMSERVSERLALEHKLRRALEERGFTLYYQPKVSVETRHTTGLEALIRWNDPESGRLVPPVDFISVLENSGLIVRAGAWALRRVLEDRKRMQAAGVTPPLIAVNVSAVQLRHKDFIGTLESAIADGLDPSAIELEITESLLMEDIEANIHHLQRARELGFRVAMDDFGTGYSSLAYLARLPVQTLKIDRSFIARMLDDPNAMTLVSTMVSLAHAMKLKVVAEGVEMEDQARILRLLRCDEMQGYLVSKAVPLEELLQFLKR